MKSVLLSCVPIAIFLVELVFSLKLSERLLTSLFNVVTHINRDPRLDYIVTDKIFTQAARRVSSSGSQDSSVDSFIGSGKYGGVYLATSRKDLSSWAIKLVPLSSNYQTRCAINELEIGALELLKTNAEFCHIEESYFYNGDIFIIMPFLDGKSLDLISFSKLSANPENIPILCYRILSIVYILNSNNICHADISDSNFMVLKDGSVVLIDFGLSQKIIPAFPSSSSESDDYKYTDICQDEKKVADLCISLLKKIPSSRITFEQKGLKTICESIRSRRLSLSQMMMNANFLKATNNLKLDLKWSDF